MADIVYGLTPTGLVIKTLPIIRAETEAGLKLGFGESVPLGDLTFFGITNGIYSEREAQIWELIEVVSDAADPDASTGTALVAVGGITGTLPIPATPSTVVETLVGDDGTLVQAGTTFANLSNGSQFASDDDAVITALPAWLPTTGYLAGARASNSSNAYQCITAGTSAGSGGPATTALDITDGTVHWRFLGPGAAAIDVVASSVDNGPVVSASGDLSVIINAVGGMNAAVNVLDAKLGAALETDAKFRSRREQELATDGSTPAEALRADLLNVDGVTAVTIFTNLTDATDANGTPPHGVQAVVQGGVDQDVLDQIRLSIATGIVSYGTTVGTSTDSQGTVHTIKFTRPAEIDIFVDVTLTYDPEDPLAGGYPTDGDAQVIAAIVKYGTTRLAGQDVVATAVGAQAFKVQGVLDVPRSGSLGGTLIKATSGPATGDATIVISPLQIAKFDTSRVTIHSSAGTV